MDNHDVQFTVVIPARYASSRFPGKPLAIIHDKPMIQHVYERALESRATRVIVATDDDHIAETVSNFGGEVCMTAEHHQSGTERLAEVVSSLSLRDDEIVVNVQGDEPFIPAVNIQQVAANLAERSSFQIATLATPIDDADDMSNSNVVKAVADVNGRAMYFSRASIPFDRDQKMGSQRQQQMMMRHIGIYAYRAAYIAQYVAYPPSAMEVIESLEQLRALWYGDAIHIEMAQAPPPIGIDTPEDLARLNAQHDMGTSI